MNPDLKQAYDNLEAAIAGVARAEEIHGVMTEWVVLTAHQRFDDDGDGITSYGSLLPDAGGRVPYHHVVGLLEMALARSRAAAGED